MNCKFTVPCTMKGGGRFVRTRSARLGRIWNLHVMDKGELALTFSHTWIQNRASNNTPREGDSPARFVESSSAGDGVRYSRVFETPGPPCQQFVFVIELCC